MLSAPDVDPHLAVEWATFLAELLVAGVIFYEMERERRNKFLDKATEAEADQDRRDIYKAFAQTGETKSLEERSESFVQKMLDDHKNQKFVDRKKELTLKIICDRQKALFNDLGFIIYKWPPLIDPMVKVFPHAAVYIWVILHPYLLQRRADTGSWLGKPLIEFTYQCTRYVLKHCDSHGLRLRPGADDVVLRISREDLIAVRDDLAKLAGHSLFNSIFHDP